jgi:flagellar hook-length control protein FliK
VQPIDQVATRGDESRPLSAPTLPAVSSPSRGAPTDGTTPAFETPHLREAPAADTTDRLVQSLRMQFQRGGGDAVVHIRPEHLGPLTVSVRVENGVVSARVHADNPLVVEWLQSNEQTLREGLRSSGLHLDRLVIHRDDDPSARTPQREDARGRRDQRRRQDSAQSTFEITV